MAKDFDATITRAEAEAMVPELIDTLREFVAYGLCRQNNTAERKMLAETFAELSQKAVKKFPQLKFTHMGAKTIILESSELPDAT